MALLGYARVSTDGQTLDAQGAGFRSIADAWADTTTPHGRLMLTVLGGLGPVDINGIPSDSRM
jgi:DNA invertase Pin-like site-specific DNA recombinase